MPRATLWSGDVGISQNRKAQVLASAKLPEPATATFAQLGVSCFRGTPFGRVLKGIQKEPAYKEPGLVFLRNIQVNFLYWASVFLGSQKVLGKFWSLKALQGQFGGSHFGPGGPWNPAQRMSQSKESQRVAIQGSGASSAA